METIFECSCTIGIKIKKQFPSSDFFIIIIIESE